MKVQRCPSCRTGYSVERLEPGATFDCRRCSATIQVAARGSGDATVPIGLLVAGLLALVGLLLYANPRFGTIRSWPWDYAREGGALTVIATLAVWAFLGLWAVLTALLPSFDRRSVLTLALGVLALLLASAPEGYGLGIDLPRTLPWMAGVIALAAGFVLVLQDRFGLGTRLLLLAGGLLLVWLMLARFEEDTASLSFFVQDLKALFAGTLSETKAGPTYLWQTIAPQLGALLAAVLGLLVGLGVRARPLAWIGGVVVVAAMLLPAAVRTGSGLEGQEFGIALLGRTLLDGLSYALIAQGVALWLLLTLAITDLVRRTEVRS